MLNNLLKIKRICIAAMFLALGWILPLITGQIPEFGNMLCPMHIPVLLSGFVLGPWYGLLLGFVMPITRFLIFGMPPIYPTGICMAFELATYGFTSGLLFKLFNKIKLPLIINIYTSLLISMLVGRIIWGLSRLVCGVFVNNAFTFKMFLSGAFITAWPGIILQLILIPLLIGILYRIDILKGKKENDD